MPSPRSFRSLLPPGRSEVWRHGISGVRGIRSLTVRVGCQELFSPGVYFGLWASCLRGAYPLGRVSGGGGVEQVAGRVSVTRVPSGAAILRVDALLDLARWHPQRLWATLWCRHCLRSPRLFFPIRRSDSARPCGSPPMRTAVVRQPGPPTPNDALRALASPRQRSNPSVSQEAS